MNKGLVSDNTEGVRELRRTLRPLKEVWMQIGIERVDNHEGVSVKALLDSGATRMFADKKFVEKNSFKLEKLDRPVKIKNVEGTENCYTPSSISFFFSFYSRGHMYRPRVMLMSLVLVSGTFLLLSLSDIPLAIVPCNEVALHGMPHGGPSPLLLVATPIPVPQIVYKLQ